MTARHLAYGYGGRSLGATSSRRRNHSLPRLGTMWKAPLDATATRHRAFQRSIPGPLVKLVVPTEILDDGGQVHLDVLGEIEITNPTQNAPPALWIVPRESVVVIEVPPATSGSVRATDRAAATLSGQDRIPPRAA